MNTAPPVPGYILIVEDDADIRAALGELLIDEGYRIETAVSGREALEKLETLPLPALILLDLMMPEMNGLQFREVQKRDARLAAVPVVLLSAQRDLAGRAEESDMAGHLNKPVDLEALLETVQKFCRPA